MDKKSNEIPLVVASEQGQAQIRLAEVVGPQYLYHALYWNYLEK